MWLCVCCSWRRKTLSGDFQFFAPFFIKKNKHIKLSVRDKMVYRVVCIRLDMKSIYWKSCCFDVIILNLISSNLQVISFCGFWLLLCYLQKSPRKWSLVDNDISIATSKTVVCFVFFPIVSNENAYEPEEFDSHRGIIEV